jgi:hypothetical protein
MGTLVISFREEYLLADRLPYIQLKEYDFMSSSAA